MYVSKIIEYNIEDCEADLCITDGFFSIVCYAYPVNNVCIGQKTIGILSYGCKSVIAEDNMLFRIEKLPQYYAYNVTAQVVSQEAGTVRIGELVITLDATIPQDINSGDFVSFSVIRFDALL